MLSKHSSIQRDQLEMIALDQLDPSNHLVRKIKTALDFSFVSMNLKKMKKRLR
ncbi:hypothetical protein AB3U99_14575 [Niallia sp. JL1B1071]|uniref:hypothetical protein n=1 Tax=Niallia tiangongensis TaxID=3237105 RepID=UPI0037DD1C36